MRQVVLNRSSNEKREARRVEVMSPRSLTDGVTKQESLSETESGPDLRSEAKREAGGPTLPVGSRQPGLHQTSC